MTRGLRFPTTRRRLPRTRFAPMPLPWCAMEPRNSSTRSSFVGLSSPLPLLPMTRFLPPLLSPRALHRYRLKTQDQVLAILRRQHQTRHQHRVPACPVRRLHALQLPTRHSNSYYRRCSCWVTLATTPLRSPSNPMESLLLRSPPRPLQRRFGRTRSFPLRLQLYDSNLLAM